jgi:hypothetical protein
MNASCNNSTNGNFPNPDTNQNPVTTIKKTTNLMGLFQINIYRLRLTSINKTPITNVISAKKA